MCAAWPTWLVRSASATLFKDPADRLIAGFKYRGWRALAPALAEFLEEPALRLAAGRVPLLIPVPLAPDRERRRGFNQSELLADQLGGTTGWRVGGGLERRRSRLRQAALRRDARAANVEGAFRWTSSATMAGTPVLLVDDVLTTGATAAACARAVADAGIECLGVVTFARALPRPDED